MAASTHKNSFYNVYNKESPFPDRIKRKRDAYYSLGLFDVSEFLSRVEYAVSNRSDDLVFVARCLYNQGKYNMAISFLDKPNAKKKTLDYKYILSKCNFTLKNYEWVLELLEECSVPPSMLETPATFTPPVRPYNKLYSAALVLKGRALQHLGRIEGISQCFIGALRCDLQNYEAMEMLIDCHLLSSADNKKLLLSLPHHDRDIMNVVTRGLYNIQLSPFIIGGNVDMKIISLIPKLKYSIDVKIAQATIHFIKRSYDKCYEITKPAIYRESGNIRLVTLHAFTLVELKRSIDLYNMANYLDEMCTDSYLKWFVVACYFYSIEKCDVARRCLKKAITMNSTSGSPWLFLGHMFAVDNEHDQAMIAYQKSRNLLLGSHLPTMYMGIECGLKNNLEMANRFLKDAITLCSKDPFLYHELAVVMYHEKRFNEAELYSSEAVDLLKCDNHVILSPQWEPLFNNAGQIAQQLRRYSEALDFYDESLQLFPLNSTTLSNIGFIHLMMNNVKRAEEALRQAVILNRNNKVAFALFTYIVESKFEETADTRPFCIGFIDSSKLKDEPQLELHKKLLYTPSAERMNSFNSSIEFNSFVNIDAILEEDSDTDAGDTIDSDSSVYD